jgi:hypothetical protein
VVERLPNSWQPPLGRQLEVFPWTFNIADSLLCTGVVAMLIFSFVSEFKRKQNESTGDKSSDGNPRFDAAAEKI